jgi:hypothetical protein
MPRMKPEPRPALDHLGDPRQGPQGGRKPMGRGPAPKRQIDPGQLPVIQARLAAQPAGGLQARPALPRPGLIPPTRRHGRHVHGARDGRLRLAPSKPARRLESARFQRGHVGLSRHVPTWHRSPGCS